MVHTKRIDEIETPALIIDHDKLKKNIEKMSGFMKQSACSLRPHFKTHKSVVIAKMQVQAGAIGITCAKLGEAEVLANAGIDDILIANQVVDRNKIIRLAGLARTCKIMAAVDNLQNIDDLSSAALSAGSQIGVLIEADIGMGRCGVRSPDEAARLAERIDSVQGLALKGIMGYEGHCVFIENYEERKVKTAEAIHALLEYKESLASQGYPVNIVSCGGTGTSMISSQISGVTEIQAGSYVFMDARYKTMEGVDFENALFLMATVISLPEPGVAMSDSGLKCITKEFGLPQVIHPEGLELIKLAEEHGIFKYEYNFCELKVGDRIKMIPSHCCTTVNLHDQYTVTSDDRVIDVWAVDGRGKFA